MKHCEHCGMATEMEWTAEDMFASLVPTAKVIGLIRAGFRWEARNSPTMDDIVDRETFDECVNALTRVDGLPPLTYGRDAIIAMRKANPQWEKNDDI